MKSVNNYTIDDFVQDLDFRKWVHGESTEMDWDQWMKDHKQKKELIDAARSLVEATDINEVHIPTEVISGDIEDIMSSISINGKNNWKKITAVAATLIIMLALTLPFLWKVISPEKHTQDIAPANGMKMENNSHHSLALMLADSTRVLLSEGSRLEVAKDFGSQYRTIQLFGEASFEVKKNPKVPFLVYAGGIVTKVLGTEFIVRAYPNEENTTVSVHKGHVSVAMNEQDGGKKTEPAIFLLPNQKGIYHRKESRLEKTIVDIPVVLSDNVDDKKLSFAETPIPRVFGKLEQAYGIKIVYDTEVIRSCNLTAVFDDESLFDIIDIICETIHAKSEAADGQIIIYAKGCKQP